jgi:hypothetical protein
MRLGELRRLRVAQCGRGSFRVAACAANYGPREVPVHWGQRCACVEAVRLPEAMP